MKKTIAIALLSCAAFLAAAQPKVLSHRGFYTSEGKTVTDENSLESLKRAQENGIWAVEFDVHLASDDSLVILHGPRFPPFASGLRWQRPPRRSFSSSR